MRANENKINSSEEMGCTDPIMKIKQKPNYTGYEKWIEMIMQARKEEHCHAMRGATAIIAVVVVLLI